MSENPPLPLVPVLISFLYLTLTFFLIVQDCARTVIFAKKKKKYRMLTGNLYQVQESVSNSIIILQEKHSWKMYLEIWLAKPNPPKVPCTTLKGTVQTFWKQFPFHSNIKSSCEFLRALPLGLCLLIYQRAINVKIFIYSYTVWVMVIPCICLCEVAVEECS